MCQFQWLLLYSLFSLSTCILFINKTITTGNIAGKIESIDDGKQVEVYLGIPYAKPPVGPLRFEDSEPVLPWSGTILATERPPMCVQESKACIAYVGAHAANYTSMSEDCLFVNVFVPHSQNETLTDLPVFAYIHGGSNICGAALMFDGKILAAKEDVIVVTIAYRLNVLGFMGQLNTEMHGQYGLRDQILALKWIQNNIEIFGGDKNRVTLTGHSAGGWDVGVLALSPLAEGLFIRVGMMSGSINSSMSHKSSTSLREIQMFANMTGCQSARNITEIKSCLRTANSTVLAEKDFYFWLIESEDGSTKYPRYSVAMFPSDVLPGRPEYLIRTSEINGQDFFIGVTSHEDANNVVNLKALNYTNWNYIHRYMMERMARPDIPSYAKVPKKLVQHEYTNWDKPNDMTEFYNSFTKAVGDAMTNIPSITIADLLSEKGKNVYFYEYDHKSKVDVFFNHTQEASHGEDPYYLFGVPFTQHHHYAHDSQDRVISKKVMTLWSNFVKFGNPFGNDAAHTTSSYNTVTQKYLHINSHEGVPSVDIKNHYRNKAKHFWNELMMSYRLSD